LRCRNIAKPTDINHALFPRLTSKITHHQASIIARHYQYHTNFNSLSSLCCPDESSQFASMEPTTIVGITTLLVTAFKYVWDIFKDIRERRRARPDEKKASLQRLEHSLSTSGRLIQREYDRLSPLIGDAFAKGDGKFAVQPWTTLHLQKAHRLQSWDALSSLFNSLSFSKPSLR
jgi:hypothetical protein